MQADPLGLVDGASVYGYALGNPGRYADPTEQCAGPLVYACAAAASVAFDYLIDQIWGDGCYTSEEFLWSAGLGVAGVPIFKGLGLGWNAWRGWGAGLADDAVRSAASYGPGSSIQAAADAARAAGLNSRQVGNAAHTALTSWVNAFKPSWFAGVANTRVVTTSGRVIYPDVITAAGRYIDLKPNTVTGHLAGAVKAAYYYGLSGIRTRIIYYN